MRTTLYLIRHGATASNLARPYRLQGRQVDPPLDVIGVGQAEATRSALIEVSFAASYSSPLLRATQTARLIAPALQPTRIEALTECDVGRWEGLTWDEVRAREPEAYAKHMADSGSFGYPGGESFAEVYARASDALSRVIRQHVGQTILVVSHHVVIRSYLTIQLGKPMSDARKLSVEICAIS